MKLRQWLFSSLIGASLAGWLCLIEFFAVSYDYIGLFSKHDLTGPLFRSMLVGAALALTVHPLRVLYCTRALRKTSAYMASALLVVFALTTFAVNFHFNLLTPIAGSCALMCYIALQYLFSRENAFAASSFFAPFTHAVSCGLLSIIVIYCAFDAPNASKPSAPNVLVVIIDNALSEHFGWDEYHRPTSPNIDTLSREGLTLNDCQLSKDSISVADAISSLAKSFGDDYSTMLISRKQSLISSADFAASSNIANPSLADRLSINAFNSKRPVGDLAQLDAAKNFLRDSILIGQPFFLAYNLQSCEENFDVPEDIRGHFSAAAASDREKLISKYDECLWYQDRLVAGLMELLDDKEVREDTFIVIIGNQLPSYIDNDKRIPLIIRYPKFVAAGSRFEQPTSPSFLTDKMVQLLELARQQQGANKVSAISDGEGN
ncbi:MAG: sulfatase-like hydrolase/transferase [Planctomycetota bacterium]|nr:sulfatase-like hydrolase/transferase [Planctomycetota bacterium]